jgi:chromatin structure-remodeling complex subunit SFH1
MLRTDRHENVQSQLPTTLIPIRVDLDVPAHQPMEAIIWTGGYHHSTTANPAYRKPEPAPPYRIKDTFLWNLHEALITPQEFAEHLVKDLDLPNVDNLIVQISNQIRQQLEEYAGVALHPLFHVTQSKAPNGTTIQTIQNGNGTSNTNASSREQSALATPNAPATPSSPSQQVQTQQPEQPQPIELTTLTNGQAKSLFPEVPPFNSITATAEIPSYFSAAESPDDTYRCIITLSINLLSQLYTDKFEWSLLHPPGTAEKFSTLTCAELGLNGEWAATMTHAIYEAVLRLKKEACESGGLVGGAGSGMEIDNMAADPLTGAGWRFDNETLAAEWEPKLETLRKDEIERREVERERQMRRLRRETARFSSTANMTVGGIPFAPPAIATPQSGYFDNPENSETPMGRGERSKKKRRFRSLSPENRLRTPGRGTPDMGGLSGYGGVEGRLMDGERAVWRCSHCDVWGAAVWGVRDGPAGPRVCILSLLTLLLLSEG